MKILYIIECTDIYIEHCCSNLVKLKLIMSKQKKISGLDLKMPNLEYLEIKNLDYESFFDFKSFTKLKTFIGNWNTIPYLNSPLLENVH